MDKVEIYRGTNLLTEIKLDNDSTQSKTIMGENVINLSFTTSSYIEFNIGDYCTVFGEVYKVKKQNLPVVKTTGSNRYEHSLKMFAEGDDLEKAQYFFYGPNNVLYESEFALMGNADTFMDLLIDNANRVSPGWTKGIVIASKYKNLTFSKNNCLAALSRLAQEFETEYWIEGKTIHLAKRSTDTGFNFKVGYNQGLHELTRVNVDDASVITRLYPYGAEKNLPQSYPGRRLHLPPAPTGIGSPECLVTNVTYEVAAAGPGFIRVTFNWDAPTSPDITAVTIQWAETGSPAFSNNTGSKNSPRFIVLPEDIYDFKFRSEGSGVCAGETTGVITAVQTNLQPQLTTTPLIFLEKNTDLYGIIEETVFFDDIFPHRTGIVTAINAADPFSIIDNLIDFDLNAQLLPGLTAQITFNTGQLAGYTFDISAYDDGAKRITFLQNKNETKIDVPSALLKAAIGDEYVLTNIDMPTAYVKAAEQELFDRATAMLADFAFPQMTIQAVLDPKYMSAHQRVVSIGQTIWIENAPLKINRKIRLVSVIRGLVEEYSFQVTLADVVAPGKIDRLIQSGAVTQRDVNSLGSTVNTSDIFNGRLVLPPSGGGAGFESVIVETATNKLYRKP